MLDRKKVGVILGLLIALWAFSGCDRPDQSAPTQSNASSNSSVNNTAKSRDMVNEVTLLTTLGADTAAPGGVISLGWQHGIDPRTGQSMTIGRAMAVGSIDASTGARPPQDGVDMGTVTVSEGGTTLQLQKQKTPDGDFVYGLFPTPGQSSPASIVFDAGGTYTFAATGSSQFSTLSASVTAPSELVAISSPANGATVNASDGLTINWAGGFSNGAVLIHIGAPEMGPGIPPPPQDSGSESGHNGPPNGGGQGGPGGPPNGGGQGGPGGHNPPPPDSSRGGHMPPPDSGNGRHMPPAPDSGNGKHLPPPPDSGRGLMINVSSNTGSYTLTSAQLQQLLSGARGNQFEIVVSSAFISTITHDGKNLQEVVHSDDRVTFTLKSSSTGGYAKAGGVK